MDTDATANSVGEIELRRIDPTGKKVEFIFSKVAATYAIYSNGDRVVVQYADDEAVARQQRATVTLLAPLRGEINGLIDTWRTSRFPSFRAKARQYDRRTADALVVGLQGEGEIAKVLLQATRDELFEERSSIGRLHYVAMALAAGVVVTAVTWALAWLMRRGVDLRSSGLSLDGDTVVMSAACGCLGALFSIALAIRSRTVQTDLRSRDNLLDAGLRMLIGAISALLLLIFLRSGIVVVSLGELGKLSGDTVRAATFDDIAVVVTFLAGFSERLVGDLMSDRLVAGLGGKPSKVVPVPADGASDAAGTGKVDPPKPANGAEADT